MTDVRRRMRREDRRDELLRHAIEVFGRLGFRNATTSELARTAGVSEALLYQHFPSKQSLLVACIERIGDEFYEALQSLLAAGGDDPGGLSPASSAASKSWSPPVPRSIASASSFWPSWRTTRSGPPPVR